MQTPYLLTITEDGLLQYVRSYHSEEGAIDSIPTAMRDYGDDYHPDHHEVAIWKRGPLGKYERVYTYDPPEQDE